MSGLTLSQLAGQTLVVGFPADGPTREQRALAADGALGGYILFKPNLAPRTPAEIAEQNKMLLATAPRERPVLISLDQEGGRVERLKHPVLSLPPMRKLAAIGDLALIRRAAACLGKQLRALGFTLDYAPVLDIDTNPANPVIGDRAFGTTPEQVVAGAFAFADGLADASVLSCGKHFPGHGDTDLDSHLALPTLRHDRKRLDEVELVPFKHARGRLPSLMTAHVVFESIDAKVPATFSKRVMTDLLRNELGYDGAVFSDDLEMKAVADHWSIEDSAINAITAGCDLLLCCWKPELAMRAHAAMIKEAEKSPAFLARLKDAAERSLKLRTTMVAPVPLTEPAELQKALELGGERDAIAQKIAASLG